MQVGAFGPVWEESVVGVAGGSALVRGAVTAGGRAVRATMPLYQHAYTERARCLDALTHHHTLHTSYERFVERVRDPLPAPLSPHGTFPAPHISMNRCDAYWKPYTF